MRINIKNDIEMLKNKKGAFSIIAVILIFISVITITAYLDMLSKTYTLNEVQSIMDTVGDSTLKSVINDENVKEGRLAIGENYIDTETKKQHVVSDDVTKIVQDTYMGLIRKSIDNNGNVKSFKPTVMNVYMENTDYGLGVSTKKRPQLILDVTATIKIQTSNYFNSNQIVEQFFYNGKKDSHFVISYKGQKDGITELVVRSVNRIVLR